MHKNLSTVARLKRSLIQLSVFFLLQALPCIAAGMEKTSCDFEKTVDLPGLEAFALKNNSEIKAMEKQWTAAKAKPPQERSLPDPLLNMSYHNEGFDELNLGKKDAASSFRFGMEQEIPFPGKLYLKYKEARYEADREGALYQSIVQNVISRLRIAYSDYFLAHTSIEIIRKNKNLMQKLAESADARYKVGEGLQQDVIRAEVELSILQGRIITLEQERQSASAEINRLLNRTPSMILGIPLPLEKKILSLSLDQMEKMAKERSPDLKAARQSTVAAETRLELAKKQYYPDFIFRMDYFNKADLDPEWELGIGIRLPVYYRQKQDSGIKEALSDFLKTSSGQQTTNQEILYRVKDSYSKAASSEKLVELYGEGVIPQAEVSLSSALAGYQMGKIDFLTLLNSFTVLNEYQLRYYQELANFEKAMAALEEITGAQKY